MAEVDTLKSISKSLKIGGTERSIRNYRLVVCYFFVLWFSFFTQYAEVLVDKG